MTDESQKINQDEIEDLTRQAGGAASDPPRTGDSDDSATLGLQEIEALVDAQGGAGEGPSRQRPEFPYAPASAAGGAPPPPPTSPMPETRSDIEALLDQATAALASIDRPHAETPPGASAFNLPNFSSEAASTEKATLDLVRDVELDLRIELGRTHMYLEEVLKLKRGAVVPLDKLAGDPVDIFVNGRLIARGEVLVLNDNFCVRVAELIAGQNSGNG